MRLATYDAYSLLHSGTLALARMERNGVKVNEPYLDSTLIDVTGRIKGFEDQVREDPIYAEWRKIFGDRANIDSRDQLGQIVFDRLGYKPKVFTSTGKYSTEEEAFEHVTDLPILDVYKKMGKLKHLRSNYLEGIKREIVEGYVHPNYNLNTVVTYRSSCDHPNFQNVPVREEWIAEIIRRCYVARGGARCIVEIDFSGIEVRVAACYHKDPTMLAYINDPTKDMHRDMARQLYCIPEGVKVPKNARRTAKGAFVFAEFYGDYYVNCARSLWAQMEAEHFETEDGTPLKVYLARKGIKEMGDCIPGEKPRPGTFEHHVKEVEDHFWNVRFPKYGQWKKDWFAAYQKQGGFDTLTGFRIDGVFSKNDVINYPVQGSAFHCLLWSLVRLQKQVTNRELDALLIGQIHDSILADVAVEDVPAYVSLARKIMTKQLPEAWKWIITPLDVEVEVAPPGRSWYEKKIYTGGTIAV